MILQTNCADLTISPQNTLGEKIGKPVKQRTSEPAQFFYHSGFIGRADTVISLTPKSMLSIYSLNVY